jgi:hypothetical protein
MSISLDTSTPSAVREHTTHRNLLHIYVLTQNVKYPYRITDTSVSYSDNRDGFLQECLNWQ